MVERVSGPSPCSPGGVLQSCSMVSGSGALTGRYCVWRASLITVHPRVGLCRHHGSQEAGLPVAMRAPRVPPHSHPHPTATDHPVIVMSRMLHQPRHTVCDLLRLAQKPPFSSQFHNFILEEVEVQNDGSLRVAQLPGGGLGTTP